MVLATGHYGRDLVMTWNRIQMTGRDDVGFIYIDALYSYAILLTRNRTEAEDLVEKTFFRSIRATTSFLDGVSLKSSLFTILRNIWLSQLRRRRNSRIVCVLAGLIDEGDDNSRGSVARVEGLEQQDLVLTALQRLPRRFREIILLREYEELSYKEIACVLNCSKRTVMSRLARARAKLREMLSDEPRQRLAGNGEQSTII